jgi:hypothetical protein
MYIGVLTAIFGWSLLFQTLRIAGYGIAVGVFSHLFVVFHEEPRLAPRAPRLNSGVVMLTREQADRFAAAWIEAWNSHDLVRILAH